ncbi:hypothetical protein, partial [Enterobacter hormaechei]|uniref:hypothetical protein n=1 Tax=Enterobacter hormaechei TaxID=158836 RepID=UPI001E5E3465
GKGSVTLKLFNLCCGIDDIGHGQCSRNCRLIRLKVNASNKKGRFSDLAIIDVMAESTPCL